MMNSNFVILAAVLAFVLVLSIVWNIFYMRFLRKSELAELKRDSAGNGFIRNKTLLAELRPDLPDDNLTTVCPVVLPNTDDDVSEALEYIEPSRYISELLGNLYEQTGI